MLEIQDEGEDEGGAEGEISEVFIVQNLKCSPPPYIHKTSSSKPGRKFIQAIKVAAVCMDKKTLEKPDSARFPDVALARRRGSFYSSSYSFAISHTIHASNW